MKRILAYVMAAILVMFVSVVCAAADIYSPVLVNGVARDATGFYSDHDDALAAKMDAMSPFDRGNISFTNLSGGDIYYALYRDMQVRSFNLSTKMYLGGWSLTRWKGEYVESEFLDRKNDYQGGMSLHWADSDATKSLGCLGAYPLRYGDVDGDGSNELVLFIDDDLLVFSLVAHSVIFSSPLKLDDWLDAAESQKHVAQFGGAGIAAPQFQSRITKESTKGWRDVVPGQRGYAKLYFGDFDNDGKFDILVWRKFYVSLMAGDATKEFKLLHNIYIHYALIGGEYVKQPTDEATIKGWLAAKSLTWQQGYPNVSECASDAGKPIPETIDPLLNDPDVLQ